VYCGHKEATNWKLSASGKAQPIRERPAAAIGSRGVDIARSETEGGRLQQSCQVRVLDLPVALNYIVCGPPTWSWRVFFVNVGASDFGSGITSITGCAEVVPRSIG
jgi:hypothetical protein